MVDFGALKIFFLKNDFHGLYLDGVNWHYIGLTVVVTFIQYRPKGFTTAAVSAAIRFFLQI